MRGESLAPKAFAVLEFLWSSTSGFTKKMHTRYSVMLKKKRSDLETQIMPSRFDMEKRMAKVTRQDNKTRARVWVTKWIPGEISIVDS